MWKWIEIQNYTIPIYDQCYKLESIDYNQNINLYLYWKFQNMIVYYVDYNIQIKFIKSVNTE